MSKSIINPLAGIVAKAAKTLPTNTGAVAAHHQQALRAHAGGDVVIVADTSGSMSEMAGRRSKITILREAVSIVRTDLPKATVIAFDSLPATLPAGALLPDPGGGTALHLALRAAALHKPRKTIVITDGRPDSEPAALSAVSGCGIVDVIYCGDDSDTAALDFLRRLAAAGGGTVIVRDIKRHRGDAVTAIGAAVNRLALPAPK